MGILLLLLLSRPPVCPLPLAALRVGAVGQGSNRWVHPGEQGILGF
jgi:hypothetical protein